MALDPGVYESLGLIRCLNLTHLSAGVHVGLVLAQLSLLDRLVQRFEKLGTKKNLHITKSACDTSSYTNLIRFLQNL
jgi:hypothetical protein